MMKIFFTNLFVLFALFGQAKAIQFEGFEFPQEVKIENEKLVLNGLALRKVTFLGIRALAAGFYLPQPTSEPSVIEKMEGRKQLRLHFLRNVSGKSIVKAWTDELMKNCGISCPVVKEKATGLEELISNVRKNDLLEITFEKDRLILQLNGQKEGSIDGQEFVLGFLRIWIGDHPINEDLKRDLLKQFNKQGDEK